MSEHVCSISRAGIRADGRAQIELKANDGAFNSTWFISSPDLAREMLAIALTAITTGMHLDCELTDPIGQFSPVENVFLVP
jgi:hypothetical protein